MSRSKCTKMVLLSLFIFAVSGCSSIVERSEQVTPVPYAGTKVAIKKVKKSWQHYDIYGQVYLYMIDAPFSFIADTLLYPLDIYRVEQVKAVR